MENEHGLVLITEEYLEDLKNDARLLEALRALGVDNWMGYEEAQRIAFPE